MSVQIIRSLSTFVISTLQYRVRIIYLIKKILKICGSEASLLNNCFFFCFLVCHTFCASELSPKTQSTQHHVSSCLWLLLSSQRFFIAKCEPMTSNISLLPCCMDCRCGGSWKCQMVPDHFRKITFFVVIGKSHLSPIECEGNQNNHLKMSWKQALLSTCLKICLSTASQSVEAVECTLLSSTSQFEVLMTWNRGKSIVWDLEKMQFVPLPSNSFLWQNPGVTHFLEEKSKSGCFDLRIRWKIDTS